MPSWASVAINIFCSFQLCHCASHHLSPPPEVFQITVCFIRHGSLSSARGKNLTLMVWPSLGLLKPDSSSTTGPWFPENPV